MSKTRETLVFGFALFAGFFGAGNLILPPLLGFKSGVDWMWVTMGFVASAILTPFFAVLGHARLQGTMLDFGKKVSPFFSLIFCLCVYAIAVALPSPRTAAVTHEMAIAPFFNSSTLLTSIVYFLLVFIFVMNRNNVLDVLGKYLTPIIVSIILAIVVIGVFSSGGTMRPSTFERPIVSGLLEGYQTYDAVAGLIMGGVVLVSINNSKSNLSFIEKRQVIMKSGAIAMLGLFIVYAGLIAIGAFYNQQFDTDITRTGLLAGLATKTLGSFGAVFLGILVALACFTTAVGITVSVSDFFKDYFNGSKKAYVISAALCCLIGVLVGQMDVKYIIDVAIPALMFIYPLCIVLILLNVIPEHLATKLVFRAVVLITFIFSIPDFLGFIIAADGLEEVKNIIPLAHLNLGWVLPAVFAFILTNGYQKAAIKSNKEA